jgi:glyoxylase-like metal-dependent hydrolase (beta-lactamase superfamily II)/rhodanese-related sulfurtransferase
MGIVRVLPMVDEGLGNSAYLVDLGDRRGLTVDASRDLREVRRAADAAGLRIAFAADTHLHADFVSGAVQLAATDGARTDGHLGPSDGDEVDLGGLRLRAIATPGHTDEHLALLLLDGERPVGVFTGGSLIVGSAARTDLVDPGRTVELAHAQYGSVQRLLALPDETLVWPTHGAGSFCSAPARARRTSTIGRERVTNGLLSRVGGEPPRAEDFVARLLTGFGGYPRYFDRTSELNRIGPEVVRPPVTLTPLPVDDVRALLATGAQLVDVRPITAFAQGHIPNSISNPQRPAFATWLGWLTDRDRPAVVVRDPDQDGDEIAWQALKIGYDMLAGELGGGIAGWRAADLPVETTALTTPEQAAAAAGTRGPDAGGLVLDRVGIDGTVLTGTILDVRQDSEFAAGHVTGAVHVELGHLPESLSGGPVGSPAADRLPAGPVLVMCGHGERAMSAASLLRAGGRRDVTVFVGGPSEWAAATGARLVSP